MPRIVFTLACFSLSILLSAQSYQLQLTSEQQFDAAIWESSNDNDKMVLKTTDKDFFGARKATNIYVNQELSFQFTRKEQNYILRSPDESLRLIFLPFKYILPDGQQLNRRLRQAGQEIQLLNLQGQIMAKARVKATPENEFLLRVSIEKTTGFNQELLAMLSIDLLEQVRQLKYNNLSVIH